MAKKIIRLPRTREQQQANRERNERANRTILSRTLILMILCGVIAFVPLIGTLYKLMITEHDYYNEKAIKNQTRSTNLTAARGVILLPQKVRKPDLLRLVFCERTHAVLPCHAPGKGHGHTARVDPEQPVQPPVLRLHLRKRPHTHRLPFLRP